jgi:signal transduction histidine kinase
MRGVAVLTTDPVTTTAPAHVRLGGPVVGALLAVLSVAGTWLALGPGERSLHGLLEDNVLNNAITGVVFGVIAAVLLGLRPAHRIGWLLLYVALVNSVTVLGEGWTLATFHHALPGRALAAWLASWIWVPALPLGATVLPAIYPSGHAVGRFAGWIVRVGWAGGVVAGVSVAMLDDAFGSVAPGHPLGHNPVSGGRGQAAFLALVVSAALVEVVLVVVTLVWTLRRLRRSTSPEREQLAWLVVSVLPLMIGVFLNSPVVLFALTIATSITLVIGIVRYQLFDIKLVLRSGLLYGGLTGVAVAAYFGLVALITLVAASGAVPNLFAAATVGLVLVPLHRWSQGALTRLVYGDRTDPVRALNRVTEGFRSAGAGPTALEPMLTGIATALRVPAARLVGTDGRVLARVGAVGSGDDGYEVSLHHAGDPVGVLTVAHRTEGEQFARQDRALLEALGGPVAAAVRAGLLARELAASRARVLSAREGERRRLREDLHDGLGPSLSGVALGLEAARRSASSHPDRLPEILEVLHREVESLVAEVRGIIDDLGPGDVDLIASVRGHVEAVAASGDVAVELTHAGPVDRAPGEVAVAAQRIVGEALTNAVRHAGARTIRVAVTGSAASLTVEVSDDGTGAVAPRSGGVGLASMRQRAESVGGTLTVSAVPGAGTRVRAVLPVQELT